MANGGRGFYYACKSIRNNERMNKQTSQEYYDWLSKFEDKKTTDDCYTPPGVYDAVIEYVDKEVISLDGLNVVRPFYPGGDYQKDAQSYDDKTIVIDNPPFSIISKICKFYQENNIKFFLFAPALTVLNCGFKTQGLTAIIAPQTISYANGAKVNTSFITNCTPDIQAKTAPSLYQALKATQLKRRNLPTYEYPSHVVTVAKMQKLCKSGIEFEVGRSHSLVINTLDEQKQHDKKCFGGSLLVNDGKAKELQAKELQAKVEVKLWTLSERERAIVESLGAS